jgi:protoporphyrinogen oxidase
MQNSHKDPSGRKSGTSDRKRVGIIGAGPAGMTAGYILSKSDGYETCILEKTGSVGGMARSFSLFGRIVDLGPHRFFSSDPRVNKLWLEVVGDRYRMVDRTTRVFFRNRFFRYPIMPMDVLSKLGLLETCRCILSFVHSRLRPRASEDTFEDWVVNKFGRRLYSLFFKSYTEKLWGMPTDRLSSDFAKQRIRKLSLGESIITSFGLKKNKHKTLVDRFAYPLHGNGYPYERMRDSILANGGSIRFSVGVKSIERIGESYVVGFDDGSETEFDHLVSSMPIDGFFKSFKHSLPDVLNAAGNLRFRNTILAYVNLSVEGLFVDQWLYIQELSVLTGRITNFNNWVPEIRNGVKGTLLALEYWCFEEDEIWGMSDSRLLEIVKSDLVKCGFIDSEGSVEGFHVVRVNKCYPVYVDDYKRDLETVVKFASGFPNLQLVGRYGSFKYNNQDHSILMGYLAARNILYGEGNDLWEINNDYEYHESSKITSTGLSMGG